METSRTLSPVPKTENSLGTITHELLQELGKHELNIEDAALDDVVLPRLAQMAGEERNALLRTIEVDPQAVQVTQGNGALKMSDQTRSFIRSGFRLRLRNWFLPSTFSTVIKEKQASPEKAA
jgi:hypothetical protein